MRWSRILGFLGFLGSMVLVLFLATKSSSPTALGPMGSASAPWPGLGGPPPPEVGRDPKAAKRYMEQQECLAACAMEARTCESTSEDDQAEAKCRAAREACESPCRASAPP